MSSQKRQGPAPDPCTICVSGIGPLRAQRRWVACAPRRSPARRKPIARIRTRNRCTRNRVLWGRREHHAQSRCALKAWPTSSCLPAGSLTAPLIGASRQRAHGCRASKLSPKTDASSTCRPRWWRRHQQCTNDDFPARWKCKEIFLCSKRLSGMSAHPAAPSRRLFGRASQSARALERVRPIDGKPYRPPQLREG